MINITAFPYAAGNLATNTRIERITDIEITSNGEIYYVENFLAVIRKIGTDGKVTTIAGLEYANNYFGDKGAAVDAYLNRPTDIAFDASGNMYIADKNKQLNR